MIFNIFALRCPHCGKGSIKAGLYKTAKHCPACGQLLESEAGFFAGAIYPLYGMAGLLGGAVALACLFGLNWQPLPSVIAGCVVVALASPYLFWLSRSVFLHTEKRFFSRLGK